MKYILLIPLVFSCITILNAQEESDWQFQMEEDLKGTTLFSAGVLELPEIKEELEFFRLESSLVVDGLLGKVVSHSHLADEVKKDGNDKLRLFRDIRMGEVMSSFLNFKDTVLLVKKKYSDKGYPVGLVYKDYQNEIILKQDSLMGFVNHYHDSLDRVIGDILVLNTADTPEDEGKDGYVLTNTNVVGIGEEEWVGMFKAAMDTQYLVQEDVLVVPEINGEYELYELELETVIKGLTEGRFKTVMKAHNARDDARMELKKFYEIRYHSAMEGFFDAKDSFDKVVASYKHKHHIAVSEAYVEYGDMVTDKKHQIENEFLSLLKEKQKYIDNLKVAAGAKKKGFYFQPSNE